MLTLYTQDGELVDQVDMTVYELAAFLYSERTEAEKLEHTVPPYRIVKEDGADVLWEYLHDDFQTAEYRAKQKAQTKVAKAEAKAEAKAKAKDFKLDETISCQHCQSHRVGSVSGKSRDLSDFDLGNQSRDGYLPDDIGIGGGDYIEFSYCLDCGMIQGKWPLPLTGIEAGTREDEGDDEDDD